MPKRKYKRAPLAPKRFKSAFMFYSENRHKQIRDESHDKKVLASEVAKVVSREWKALAAQDKTQYEALASKDRDRYYREKAAYKGPWKIPNVKDPRAPKKPMSAFLAFSNERRKSVAEANPGMGNGEISGVLSKLWKDSPDEIKNEYRKREAEERKEFKVALAEYEKKSSMGGGSSSSDEVEEDEGPQHEHINRSAGGGGEAKQEYAEHQIPHARSIPSNLNESLPRVFQQQQAAMAQLTMLQQAAGSTGGQLLTQNTNQLSMMGNISSDLSLFPPSLTAQQQYLITLPPGPIPHQQIFPLQPGSVPLSSLASPFGGMVTTQPSITETEMLSLGAQQVNPAVRAQTQARTMNEYPSLDPFIETDTGGYLAAFAALEKRDQSNQPDPNRRGG